MEKAKRYRFAEMAINLPLETLFHYNIPSKLREKVAIGERAYVPFRNSERIGYIVNFSNTCNIAKTKSIRSIIDEEPIVSGQMLELARWISQTYLCSWGQAIDATVPGVLKKGKVSVRPRLAGRASFNGDSLHPDTTGDSLHPDTILPVEQAVPAEQAVPIRLTTEQNEVLEKILFKIDKEAYRAFLLHGITASGKTEIYLKAIEKVLAKGKTSIVLVPEIALTPQTVERFTSRFGRKVAVAHSALTGSMRYMEWKRIKTKEARIVVGARSAIFSPVENLGLIIVDEEHETSYKQEDTPRYHARDVALMRARLSNCPVILGSATPSLETYYLARKNKIELVRLTKRIDEKELPKVKIVDMRMELATRKRLVMFSKILITGIERALAKKGQVMIFLNRRGFSTYINCKKCGHVLKCRRCDSALVYHYQTRNLICHYCNFKIPPPDICPRCKSSYMKYFGIGTEKVESELARFFPRARIARMDTDSMRKRGSHAHVLGEFKKHNIDILVGTQMIAKGLDFPRVTLVGVVNADVMLNLPDFRASERTFNLLTQVAGRAGRGEAGGEVIVQTYAPEHYAIRAASKHDYEKFYQEEIKARKETLFPPFRHIVKLVLRSRNENRVQDAAKGFKSFLDKRLSAKGGNVEIIGPAPAPVSKVRGFFRWNILLKGKNRSIMCESLRKALTRYRRPRGVILTVDVDPMSM